MGAWQQSRCDGRSSEIGLRPVLPLLLTITSAEYNIVSQFLVYFTRWIMDMLQYFYLISIRQVTEPAEKILHRYAVGTVGLYVKISVSGVYLRIYLYEFSNFACNTSRGFSCTLNLDLLLLQWAYYNLFRCSDIHFVSGVDLKNYLVD